MAFIKITQKRYPKISGDQHTNNLALPWLYEKDIKVNSREQLILISGSVHGAIRATVNPPPGMRKIGFIVRINIKGGALYKEFEISTEENRHNGVAVHVALPTLMEEISLRPGVPYQLSVEPLPGTACERIADPPPDIFSIFIYD